MHRDGGLCPNRPLPIGGCVIMVLIVCKDQTNGFQSFRMRSFLEIIGKSLWCLKSKLFIRLKVLNLIVQRIPLQSFFTRLSGPSGRLFVHFPVATPSLRARDNIAMRSLGLCGEIFLILSGNPLEKLDRFLYFELTCF